MAGAGDRRPAIGHLEEETALVLAKRDPALRGVGGLGVEDGDAVAGHARETGGDAAL